MVLRLLDCPVHGEMSRARHGNHSVEKQGAIQVTTERLEPTAACALLLIKLHRPNRPCSGQTTLASLQQGNGHGEEETHMLRRYLPV
jgi:hypothetical protein